MVSVSVSLPTISTVNPSHKLSKQRSRQNPLNSTLKFLSKSGKLDEAFHLLLESQKSKTSLGSPNLESYTTLLHACISRKSLDHGQRLYLYLLKDNKSFLNNPILKSKFITLFSVCGLVDEARRVFDHDIKEMEHLPESVCVAMAIGYSKNGKVKEALLVYCNMLSWGVEPGNFSFSVALKACSELLDLRIGKGVHAQIIKANEEPDQVVHNALLRFYTECGSFEDVVHVFEEMPEQNVVTWNSLVAGLVKKDQVFEAFETFRRMQNAGVRFSWVSLTTILVVCGRLTALYIGREMHAQIIKSEKSPDLLVLNSLLDMYAKCGELEYCRRVFDGMIYKDLISWNTLINGYAINGYMEEAMEAFEGMVAAGFRPDEVTFISLLSGCSHAGMTAEGRLLFDRMQVEFRIVPNLEHYACLVDILGRAGKIDEAMQVTRRMPMNPSGSIWGSLLNSSRLYGNVSLAELVARQLFKIEPNNPGNYVLLSNIYANAGMWDKVDLVREFMEQRGIKKEAGCSWIQIKDRIHSFVAGGGFEFRNSDEYTKVWNELTEAMEKRGYKPDTGVVLHDIDEEMKAKWVCGHSERLATVFALIHRGSGLPIRITKNLRVCADCHTWMKFVSEVTRSKIILRDTNRFHHFYEGTCSCNDYW